MRPSFPTIHYHIYLKEEAQDLQTIWFVNSIAEVSILVRKMNHVHLQHNRCIKYTGLRTDNYVILFILSRSSFKQYEDEFSIML